MVKIYSDSDLQFHILYWHHDTWLPQPLSCFIFHLPNLLVTQNFVYPITLFSLNTDRVLGVTQLIYSGHRLHLCIAKYTRIKHFTSFVDLPAIIRDWSSSWGKFTIPRKVSVADRTPYVERRWKARAITNMSSNYCCIHYTGY